MSDRMRIVHGQVAVKIDNKPEQEVHRDCSGILGDWVELI